jgi:hypothetical protein
MNFEVTTQKGKIILPVMTNEQLAAINTQLVSSGLSVYEITTVKNDLETIFINMVNS